MSSRTALLLIDIQQGLDDPRHGERSTPQLEARLTELLAGWRRSGKPVIHVQHMSREPNSLLRPGLPGNDFKPEALPITGEPIFQKTASCGFIGTHLEAHLCAQGIQELVIAGLTTDHCVSSTTRMASDLGLTVTVLSDVTAAHARRAPDGGLVAAEEMQRVALASLDGEFATVRSAAEVLRISTPG